MILSLTPAYICRLECLRALVMNMVDEKMSQIICLSNGFLPIAASSNECKVT